MVAFSMSLSCSDHFSGLLCREDSDSIFSGDGDESQGYSSDVESQTPDIAESIAGLLEDERDLTEINSQQQVDASLRSESVAWILKVQRYYGFHPLTAYLSVTYLDRFLNSHPLPALNGWPFQLLSTACLSLAAKMEETLVPSLLDLQVEGAKFIFEPRNIQRMELLVLRILEWRLRSISPFWYLSFFAAKVDPTGTYTAYLVSRAKEIILATIEETNILGYRPSSIAAATMLCAANDLPIFSLITAHHAESWCEGLQKEKVMSCHEMMQRIIFNTPMKQPKVLPQLRVMTRVSVLSCNTSSSSSSSFSSPCKRSRLNNSWEDNDKRSSD